MALRAQATNVGAHTPLLSQADEVMGKRQAEACQRLASCVEVQLMPSLSCVAALSQAFMRYEYTILDEWCRIHGHTKP